MECYLPLLIQVFYTGSVKNNYTPDTYSFRLTSFKSQELIIIIQMRKTGIWSMVKGLAFRKNHDDGVTIIQFVDIRLLLSQIYAEMKGVILNYRWKLFCSVEER